MQPLWDRESRRKICERGVPGNFYLAQHICIHALYKGKDIYTLGKMMSVLVVSSATTLSWCIVSLRATSTPFSAKSRLLHPTVQNNQRLFGRVLLDAGIGGWDLITPTSLGRS